MLKQTWRLTHRSRKKKMSDARIKTTGLSFLSYCCFRFLNFRSSFHGSDVLTSTKPQTRMKFKVQIIDLLNWTFKVVLLFSYQASLTALASDFIILSQAFLFVNNFFSFLFLSEIGRFSFKNHTLLRDSLFILPLCFITVKTLFHSSWFSLPIGLINVIP